MSHSTGTFTYVSYWWWTLGSGAHEREAAA